MGSRHKTVTSDPWNAVLRGSCEACGQPNHPKRPTVKVILTAEDVAKRARVVTSPYPNPFEGKQAGPFLLCTNCRSAKIGWAVICQTRTSEKAASALLGWKRRVSQSKSCRYECYICEGLKASGLKKRLPSEKQLKKGAVLNTRLNEVLLYSEASQKTFCSELSERTGLPEHYSRFLLRRVNEARFCSLHHNQTRQSHRSAANNEPANIGTKQGFCVFHKTGCSGSSSVLRPFPNLSRNTLEDTEEYFEYDDAVRSFSGRSLSAEDVSGKHVCGTCKYIVTKGVQGIKPELDTAVLRDVADRCLVDCIMYALKGHNKDSVLIAGNEAVTREARSLHSKVLVPFKDVPQSRFVPILEVFKLRKVLHALSGGDSSSISDRAVELRIAPFLAARGVHLYSLTRKTRCYAFDTTMLDTVQGMISLSSLEEVQMSFKERRRMFTTVCNQFIANKGEYMKGNWSLSDEIAAIPSKLWASTVLDMASDRQLASWKVFASETGKPFLDVFPVSNKVDVLPRNVLDNYAQASLSKEQGSSPICRSDFLLCLRALTNIEQSAYTRSRLSVGPLKMTLSIAGIVETSASWTGVLNALGLVTSSSVTEAFRKKLIADRENAPRGAFEDMDVKDRVVTVQIDNFDILPFHSVKAAGKQLPMISGTATQSIIHSRKRAKLEVQEHAPSEDPHHSRTESFPPQVSWLNAKEVLQTREHFVTSLNSDEDKSVLSDFFDLVFGVAYHHRESILGTSPHARKYRKGKTEKLFKHQGVNFRTLLLSCLKPHGGADPMQSDAEWKSSIFEQDVVFVDICRMSAADILTIHQKLSLIKSLLRPGEPGCPAFIIVCGDQPTYKMLVTIWLNSYCDAQRGRPADRNSNFPDETRIHEWLIPFPGFFHVEKQSLYPVCKELLHGLGLTEMASCCGLSQAQVENVLKHGHARNNRSLIFNICAALVIHTSDIVLAECPDLKDTVQGLSDEGPTSQGQATESNRSQRKLLRCVSEHVSDSTLRIGALLRERVQQFFSHSPNGKHIVHTVLFTCLLPTVGFHVLSRTGHTDVVDSFWLRLTNVLHTTGHLKYQELYLFYGFFRAIMPRVAFSDVYSDKPGAMVSRVPSFTSGVVTPYDMRGWVYLQMDENLEMTIIRHVKDLSVIAIPYLETAGSWLLVVAKARMIIRGVTAAPQSQVRHRQEDEAGEQNSLVMRYDKNAVQSSSVKTLLELLRSKGFLSGEHRSSETLRNVLGRESEDLPDMSVQKLILDADNHGRKSAELHAACMLPDVFGSLTEEDYKQYFGGKRFKGKWTKARQIPTAGSIMKSATKKSSVLSSNTRKDPKKALSDRRHAVMKLMTALTLAEHAALSGGDREGAEHARDRWHKLHDSRYIMSPFADAYRSSDDSIRHAQKSRILSALNLEWYRQMDATSEAGGVHLHQSQPNARQGARKSVTFYYDYSVPNYYSVMVDIMNHVWTRGTDGRRGTSLFHVTLLKMKHYLRPWFSGRRGRGLKQIHLHVDDPTLVIPQKSGEQARRDASRDGDSGCEHVYNGDLYKLGFLESVDVPWSSLIKDRRDRDAVCSLHLFCAGVAALELSNENQLQVEVFLFGGCFCFKSDVVGRRVHDLLPQISTLSNLCERPRSGEVILLSSAPSEDSSDEDKYLLQVPRTRVLKMSNPNGIEITDSCISHGESETRFVAGFQEFVSNEIAENEQWVGQDAPQNSIQSGTAVQSCAAVVLSKDTDVTMILCLAECLRGQGILHVLGENVIDIDVLRSNLLEVGIDERTLCSVYVLGGCGFTPGTFGVTHEQYLRATVRHQALIGSINERTTAEKFELMTILAYLEKHGSTELVTYEKRDELREEWTRDCIETTEVRQRMKQFFLIANPVGSKQWCIDARNHVCDKAKSLAELVPPLSHITLQGRRVQFVVFSYWALSWRRDLTPSQIGGTNDGDGFTETGDILLEADEELKKLKQQMKELVAKCGCKGHCNSRQCSCVKRDVKCMGCDCDPGTCENKLTTHQVEQTPQDCTDDFIDEMLEDETLNTDYDNINDYGLELLGLSDSWSMYDAGQIDSNDFMSCLLDKDL